MVNDKCIVLPAAGASTRLGQPKQLVQIKGESLIRRAVKASVSICENVIVVLGAGASEIESNIDDLPAKVIFNDSWELGMGSSISLGIRTAQRSFENTKGALIHLCDLPLIDKTHLSLLLSNSDSDIEKIVYSVYENFEGVPAYFPRRYFEELMALEGDKGAQGIISSADPMMKVGVKLGMGYFDIDEPGDYEKLRGF